jgi:hypothetical protein
MLGTWTVPTMLFGVRHLSLWIVLLSDAFLVTSPSCREQYGPLLDWLNTKTKIIRMSSVHLAFGPGGSFFACDTAPGVGYTSRNIPSHLRQTLILHKDKTPARVTLGIGDSYFLLWSDGEYIWQLRGQYPELDLILAEAKRTGRPIQVRITPYNLLLLLLDSISETAFVAVPSIKSVLHR